MLKVLTNRKMGGRVLFMKPDNIREDIDRSAYLDHMAGLADDLMVEFPPPLTDEDIEWLEAARDLADEVDYDPDLYRDLRRDG